MRRVLPSRARSSTRRWPRSRRSSRGSVAVFGGVVDPNEAPVPLSRMPASDARDWDAIDEWAGEVATAFKPHALAGRKS